MCNMILLVGRLFDEPKIIENKDGKNEMMITLEVKQKFKSSDENYHTDIINCYLNFGFAQKMELSKGTIIGVRGYLQNNEQDNSLKVKATSITFLSKVKENEYETKKEFQDEVQEEL